MAISDKLTYLGETKSILKDTINMSNANITNSTTFRNYATQLKEGYIDILNNGTDTLYNNFTHLTGKGMTLSFAPTYQAPMKITCYGSTSQASTPTPSSPVDVVNTTGNQTISVSDGTNTDTYNIRLSRNNVLNSITWRRIKTSGGYPVANDTVTTIISSDNNNITFTATGDYGGVESDFMPVKNGDKYTISFSGTLPNRFFITQYNSSKTRVSTLNTTTSVSTTTFTASQDGYVAFGFSNTSLSSNKFVIKNIMVNTGVTALDYEPYIEPIELCKIGDYEDKIDKSTGKNLFDINGDVNTRYNGQTSNKNTVNGNDLTTTSNSSIAHPYGQKIYVGIGNTVTMSATLKSITYDTEPSSDVNVCSFNLYNDNTTTGAVDRVFKYSEIGTRKILTFTATTDYIYATFGRSNSSTSATFTDIQVEIGSSATSYEPYGTDWYLKKNIGKYIFDGTENWTSSSLGTNSWTLANIINTIYDTTKKQIVSNIFRGISQDERNTAGDNTIYTTTNTQFMIRNTDLTTKGQVQTTTNGDYIYYQLATPTYTKITDSTLIEQLEAIKSKDNTTNITSSMVIGAIALKKE